MRRALVMAVLCATGCTTLLGVDFDSAFPAPTDGGPASDGGGSASSDGSSNGAADGSSPRTCVDGSCADGADGSPQGGPCAESPCKAMLPQCGCPSGQACYLAAAGPKCTAPGIVDESDQCTTNAECIPGHVCAQGQDGVAVKVCKRLCQADGDCVGPGSICLQDSGFKACSIGCNPVTSSRCPPSAACQLYQRSGDMAPFTDCGGIGTRQPLQSCSDAFPCVAGYVCGTTSGGATACIKYCTPSDCSSCDVMGTFGGTSYGVCR
jgi:hypothetical protein